MEYNCRFIAVLEISVDIKTAKKIFMYKTELDSVLSPVIINKVFHLVHMNVWWDI